MPRDLKLENDQKMCWGSSSVKNESLSLETKGTETLGLVSVLSYSFTVLPEVFSYVWSQA